MAQTQSLTEKFANDAKEFAEWCRQMASAHPGSRPFYADMAKKVSADAKSLQQSANAMSRLR